MPLFLIHFLITSHINWFPKNYTLFVVLITIYIDIFCCIWFNFNIILIFRLIQIKNFFTHLINWHSNGIVLCFEGLKHRVIFLTVSKHVIVHVLYWFHSLLKFSVFSFQVIKGFWLNCLIFIHFFFRFLFSFLN